jgi:tRNA pseudouridine38-40 synthase
MTDPAQSISKPQTWKLTLAYDGTDFRGWQVQPGERTIQGELQAALGRVTGESPLPQGSGRTDAGVHALAQVASFVLQAPIPAQNLLRALNRTLPQAIRVLESTTMPETFHARHSAIAKTYEYGIFRGEICPPFLSRYAYACPWPMDFEAIEASARYFLGRHDFLSFAATDPDLSTRNAMPEPGQSDLPRVQGAVRTIFASAWRQRQTPAGSIWLYRIRGDGFLHHMVRNMVGTMLDVGRGHLDAEDMPAILAAGSRSAAGPTAPARGLFLDSVEFIDEQETAAKPN